MSNRKRPRNHKRPWIVMAEVSRNNTREPEPKRTQEPKVPDEWGVAQTSTEEN